MTFYTHEKETVEVRSDSAHIITTKHAFRLFGLISFRWEDVEVYHA